MSQIIPFDSDNLPAHLADDAKLFNADLAGHVSVGFPVLSIKGKAFAIKRDGARHVIANPKDPESAATSLEVVVLRVNKHKSKVFYAKGWKEGDDGKPDCFSNDGLKPDASVEKPQAKSCATCPKNAWGSKVTESGTKVKACSDSIRAAVAAPNDVNDPMLLRIPAASMKALSELAAACNRRGVAYNMAVTRISFDANASTPKLIFKAIGLLPTDLYQEVKQVALSDTVDSIINGGGVMPESTASSAPSADEEEEEDEVVTTEEIEESVIPTAEEQPEKPKAKPKVKPAAKPKSEPEVVVEVDDLDLSDIDFDD